MVEAGSVLWVYGMGVWLWLRVGDGDREACFAPALVPSGVVAYAVCAIAHLFCGQYLRPTS